jgi:hypothetical protein
MSFVPTLKSVASHGVHVASATVVAEAVKYSPAGHVVFLAAQDVTVLSPALKFAEAQAVHVASALSEPAVKYSPDEHVAVLVEQAVTSLTPALKSVAAHGVHVASVAAVAEAVKYSPAGHVVFLAAHDVTVLSPTLNSSAAQAVHVASALGEPAVKYLPAAHDAVRVWHAP